MVSSPPFAVEEVVARAAVDPHADGGLDEDLVVVVAAVGRRAEPPAEEDEVVAAVAVDEVDVLSGVEVVGLVGADDGVVAPAGVDAQADRRLELDRVCALAGAEGSRRRRRWCRSRRSRLRRRRC
jgi:hypothetical protein